MKLLSLAGAYWRGDETKPQLTRVYGTAFYEPKDLEDYLHRIEEAKRRDHRRLGKDLDLFEFSELSPGMPFWHPRGMVIWNVLEDLRRRENAKRGYHEVRTPLLYDSDLWRTSGHWEKYQEDMFRLKVEGRDFALKPMNCPGHCSSIRSRRIPIATCRCASRRPATCTGTSSPASCTGSSAFATSSRTTRTSTARTTRSRTS